VNGASNVTAAVIATTGDDFHRGTERKPQSGDGGGGAAAPRRKRPVHPARFRAFFRAIESSASDSAVHQRARARARPIRLIRGRRETNLADPG